MYLEASYPTTLQLFYRKSRSSKYIIKIIEMQCFMIGKMPLLMFHWHSVTVFNANTLALFFGKR